MTENVVSHIDEFQKLVDEAAKKQLVKIAQRFERIIQGLFRTPHSGRIYKHGGVEHRASAPGEAPAIDTAALSKAVTHAEPTKIGDVLSIDIGVTEESGRAQVAEYLEFGTSTIEPRPAWRPALEMLKQEQSEE